MSRDPTLRLLGESAAVSLFCIVCAAYIKRIWIMSFSTAQVIYVFFSFYSPQRNSSRAHSVLHFHQWHTLSVKIKTVCAALRQTPFICSHWSLTSQLICLHAGMHLRVRVCTASGRGSLNDCSTNIVDIIIGQSTMFNTPLSNFAITVAWLTFNLWLLLQLNDFPMFPRIKISVRPTEHELLYALLMLLLFRRLNFSPVWWILCWMLKIKRMF